MLCIFFNKECLFSSLQQRKTGLTWSINKKAGLKSVSYDLTCQNKYFYRLKQHFTVFLPTCSAGCHWERQPPWLRPSHAACNTMAQLLQPQRLEEQKARFTSLLLSPLSCHSTFFLRTLPTLGQPAESQEDLSEVWEKRHMRLVSIMHSRDFSRLPGIWKAGGSTPGHCTGGGVRQKCPQVAVIFTAFSVTLGKLLNLCVPKLLHL